MRRGYAREAGSDAGAASLHGTTEGGRSCREGGVSGAERAFWQPRRGGNWRTGSHDECDNMPAGADSVSPWRTQHTMLFAEERQRATLSSLSRWTQVDYGDG